MIRILLAGLLGFATPALAQDEDTFRFGNDVFAAGGSVTVDAAGADDVFAVGERIDLAGADRGLRAPPGAADRRQRRCRRRRLCRRGRRDAWRRRSPATPRWPATTSRSAPPSAATCAPPPATSGVGAPVAGYALLAAETVAIDAAIGGDAAIDADTLDFGPGRPRRPAASCSRATPPTSSCRARSPPPTASSAIRSARPDASGAGAPGPVLDRAPSWLSLAIGFVIGVAILAVLALVVALAAPRGVERLAVLVGERPFYTFWIGFLTLSALIGATFLAGRDHHRHHRRPRDRDPRARLRLRRLPGRRLPGRPGDLALGRPAAARHAAASAPSSR